MIVKYLIKNWLIVTLGFVMIVLQMATLSSNKKDRFIVFEKTELGYVPAKLSQIQYTEGQELIDFIRIASYFRYNYTHENIISHTSSFFKLCSKRVHDTLEKQLKNSKMIEKITRNGLSQNLRVRETKMNQIDVGVVKVVQYGDIMQLHGEEIQSRYNVKITFIVRRKSRPIPSSYTFYIDNVQEEKLND